MARQHPLGPRIERRPRPLDRSPHCAHSRTRWDRTASSVTAAPRSSTPTVFRHSSTTACPTAYAWRPALTDLLINWEKHPSNPVIPDPGPGAEFVVTGAPCGWVEDGVYYAITGNSHQSPDNRLPFQFDRHVQFGSTSTRSTKAANSPIRARTAPSPISLSLTERRCCLSPATCAGRSSTSAATPTSVSRPERHKRLAFAESRRTGAYCEGQTLLDDRGRRILFARFSEARFKYALIHSGWAGICALPLLLSLAEDDELLLDPVPELEALRSDHLSMQDVRLSDRDDVRLDITGDALEVRTVLEWDDAEEVGFKVRCSPDGEEETLVRWNVNPGRTHVPPDQVVPIRELILDVSRSSLSPDVSNRESQRATFEVPLRQRGGTAHFRGPQRRRGHCRSPSLRWQAHLPGPAGQRGGARLRPRRQGCASFIRCLAHERYLAVMVLVAGGSRLGKETIPKRCFDRLSTNGTLSSAQMGLLQDRSPPASSTGQALSLSKGSAQRGNEVIFGSARSTLPCNNERAGSSNVSSPCSLLG